MATADKLTYLNTTKSQLKDMINYGLDNNNKITNSTTFRNYVSSIFNAFLESLRTPDTLFTNLPKKSGTGANITLNDTANAPMRIELGASEISQAGTPTPSSPQEIHSISGNNVISVCNKNLINQVETNKYASSSGVVSSGNTSYLGINDYVSCLPSTSYAISLQHDNSSASLYVSYKDKSGNFISRNSYGTNRTFTTPDNAYYLFFYVYKADEFTTVGGYVQLEYGSSATTYVEHEENNRTIQLGDIEYCKIGNYEDKFIRTSEKNIFDINNPMFINKPLQSDGTVWGTSSVSNVSQYIAVQPNTPYTISLTNDSNTRRICYYKSPLTGETADNTKFIKYEEYSGNSKTFTTPNECNYIRFGYYNGTDKIKLNMGASFVPNTWYIKKNIGKKTFNGTESWNYSSTTSTFAIYNPISDIYNKTQYESQTIIPQVVCDYYKPITWYNMVSGTIGLSMLYANNVLQMRLYSTYTIDTDFKNWLSSNNVHVYYILATPTYTQITGTLAEQLEKVYQKMLSYTGQTNILQVNNDLSFNLSVQAIEDLN